MSEYMTFDQIQRKTNFVAHHIISQLEKTSDNKPDFMSMTLQMYNQLESLSNQFQEYQEKKE